MWVALIEGFADLYHNKSDNWKADWITKIHIGWIWGLEAHMMYCRILICGFVKRLCTYNSRINGRTWLCFPCGCRMTNWPHRTMSDLIWMAVQRRRRHMLCDITTTIYWNPCCFDVGLTVNLGLQTPCILAIPVMDTCIQHTWHTDKMLGRWQTLSQHHRLLHNWHFSHNRRWPCSQHETRCWQET